MVIIVGLGNPEEKYKKTRHNLGFLILDELQKQGGFSGWKKSKNGNCLYSKGEIAGKETELIKPLTYMNSSGRAVKYALTKHNLSPENIFVIHDDIDLPFAKIKISKGSGSAGHKGVESIIKEIKSKDFIRLRIGILPKFGKPKNPTSFVLQKFNREEEKSLKEVIQKTIDAIETAIKDGTEKAQSIYN